MSNKSLTEVKKEVLKKIVPGREEKDKASKLAERIKAEVEGVADRFGLQCEIRINGSFAKDTWLKGEGDIDITMAVSKTLGRDQFGEICLRVAKESVKEYGSIERYAEHPYIEAIVDGYCINIVPCYLTEQNHWISAADRTPFHTKYMKKHLGNVRDGVRVLKKFMKGKAEE